MALFSLARAGAVCAGLVLLAMTCISVVSAQIPTDFSDYFHLELDPDYNDYWKLHLTSAATYGRRRRRRRRGLC